MRHAIRISFIVALGLLGQHTYGQVVLLDTLSEFRFIALKDIRSEGMLSDSLSSIEILRSSTLTDMLAQRSGLYVKDYGPGNIANVTLRGGTAQQTEVFWNGMAINSPSLGLTDISLIPAVFISQAWADQGGTSLMEGSGGATGAIRLQSAETHAQQLHIRQALLPEVGASSTSASIQWTEGAIRARTALHRYTADNRYPYVDDSHREAVERERENAGASMHGAAQDLFWQLDPVTTLHYATHVVAAQREIATPIGVSSRGEDQRDEIWRNSLKLERNGSRSLQEFGIGHTHEYQRYQDPLSEIDSRIHTQRLHARYIHQRSLFSKTQVKLRVDNDISYLSLYEQGSYSLTETGVFLALEHKLSDHSRVDLSMRQEWIEGPSDPWSIAAVYHLEFAQLPELGISASYAHTFRNPTLNDLYWPELGNTALQAEQGQNFALVTRWKEQSYWFQLEGFASDTDDMIRWSPDVSGRFRPLNVDQNRNVGVEAKWCFQQKRFQAKGGASYIDSRFKDQEGDWSINIYQPRYRTHLYVEQQVGSWTLHARGLYSSEVLTDRSMSHSSELPAVVWLDAGLSWLVPRSKGMFLSIEMRNLMDKNYEFIKDRPGLNRHLQLQLILDINEI